MTSTITCPMCQADVVLERGAANALCTDCHDLSDEEMAVELQRRVNRAVWTALRAVEDQAAYARWAAREGKPVPPTAEESQEAGILLREVLTKTREW